MRYFPGARLLRDSGSRARRTPVPVYLAAAAVSAALVVPVAHADNDTDHLKGQQKKVHGQIDQATDDLHEASRKVARITRRLAEAQSELRSARAHLVEVKDELSDARALAKSLTKKLNKAEARLETAVAELKAARRDVRIQRETTRDTVIGIATEGDPRLTLISSYLNSGTVEEVMVSETGNAVVVGRQQNVLNDFLDAEDTFEANKVKVEDARDEVADSKRAAEKNLANVEALLIRAKEARSEISGLVDQRETAKKAAEKAKAADAAALARLEERERRIKQQILNAAKDDPGSNFTGNSDGYLHVPASGPVTSPFGYRVHPIYGYYGLHNGTDFGAACGSAVWAGAAGKVVSTYYDEVYGNRLYLAIGRVNGATITLVYNHLSSYAVSQGDRVRRGQVLGAVGTTGWSTGCHLHFIVMKNGTPVDPMNYL